MADDTHVGSAVYQGPMKSAWNPALMQALGDLRRATSVAIDAAQVGDKIPERFYERLSDALLLLGCEVEDEALTVPGRPLVRRTSWTLWRDM